MRKRSFFSLLLAGCVAGSMMVGCGSTSSKDEGATTKAASSNAATSSADEAKEGEGGVLKVGMECAYAPFNWTQDTDTTPDGSKAEPIYDSNYYAYGYDVAVAQMLAKELGMELEIHKVEWSSIGISLDAGDYDCIIAGMGKTAEREMSFETTSECFMAVSNGIADVSIVDLPTAQSALLTNKDLSIIVLDEADTFSGDEEMVNVCIATRKDDTALRDKLQGAMDSIGWNDKAKMDELMEKAISQQPAAN